MTRYLDLWDVLLRPFGRIAWRNPNYLFGVQIEPRPTISATPATPSERAMLKRLTDPPKVTGE